MIVYDDKSDLCTARVAKLWGNVSYFPGAVPVSSLPKGVINLTEKEMNNKIWYVTEKRIYPEYTGVGRLYRDQKSFVWSIFGWMHIVFPFNILVFIKHLLNKALQEERLFRDRKL